MTLRVGWLTPFTNRSGVGTFGKAVTDAMPDSFAGEAVDLTILTPLSDGLYRTRHRTVDIASVSPDSGLYGLFDVLVFNLGNNAPFHEPIVEVMRNFPGVVICHDYVYQHLLAHLVQKQGSRFADYIALVARYGSAEGLRVARQSNISRATGPFYAPWDSDASAAEPLAAVLMQLGSALVVHSRFAERYARAAFDGPVLRLGMPHDQRAPLPGRANRPSPVARDRRVTLASFGHIQSTKCIDDVILAIAGSPELRDGLRYVVAGFAGDRAYLDRLRDLVSETGLADTVCFSPNLSDAALADLVEVTDGFINIRYPNTEGASVSLIEQLVTGKPVIVLDTGCYAEVPDDAAIKVARVHDPKALAQAMARMLGDRGALAELGRRGRAYATRHDCAGYVAGLLGFLTRERALLRRRGAVHGRQLIDFGGPGPGDGPGGTGWAAALSTARTTFDLLGTGCLATDPVLIRDLGPDRLVDYVQAAILRDGTNLRLTAALRDFLRDAQNPYLAVLALQVAQRAAVEGDAEALAALPTTCPHDDLAFWEVVAALGPQVLSPVCHHAFFGGPPSEPAGRAAPGHALDQMLPRQRLADALAARSRARLVAPPDHLEQVLHWLRRIPLWGADPLLERLAVGRSVRIGSAEQHRFLKLSGFFDPLDDHAWSGAGLAIVHVAPAREARRVVLSGRTLDQSIAVAVAADIPAADGPVSAAPCADGSGFTIELPDGEVGRGGILSLTIRSSQCRSPRELGLSGDPRLLGFCLYDVSLA